MYMAAIGHIHGNFPAFDAVYKALDEEGIHTVVNTGDSAVGLEWPNEVIDLLRYRFVPSVLGEQDRRTVHFHRKQATLRNKSDDTEFESFRSAYEALRAENLEYLRSLPRAQTLEIEGLRILLCHGTPANPSASLTEDDSLDKFKRQREIADADIVIGGGTEDRYVRTVDRTLFVSPGALADSTERVATYTLINTETTPWSVKFCDVPY